MTRRIDLTDPDNPEWIAADFARGIGPEGLSDAELSAFLKTRVRMSTYAHEVDCAVPALGQPELQRDDAAVDIFAPVANCLAMSDAEKTASGQTDWDQSAVDKTEFAESLPDQDAEMDGSNVQPVVRATDFVHVASDSAFIFDLGKDLEISHFRIDPAPSAVGVAPNDKGIAMRIQVRQQMLEVARIRMSPGAAVQLAMSILQVLNEKGVLKHKELRDEIFEMIGNFDAATEATS